MNKIKITGITQPTSVLVDGERVVLEPGWTYLLSLDLKGNVREIIRQK